MGFQSSMFSANCCRIDDDYQDRSSSENQEESGWTVYFEDLMVNYQHNDSTTTAHDQVSSSSTFSSGESSSMISDADAAIAAGLSASCKHSDGVLSSMKRFKRRRMSSSRFIIDHDLEDTASSAVQTSKLNGHLSKQASGNQIRHLPNQETGFGHGGFLGKESNFTQQQVRRKGLCLVPVSMIYNVTHHVLPLN